MSFNSFEDSFSNFSGERLATEEKKPAGTNKRFDSHMIDDLEDIMKDYSAFSGESGDAIVAAAEDNDPTHFLDAAYANDSSGGRSDAASFIADITNETVESMAEDAAVNINLMNVGEDVKLNAIRSVEDGSMQSALGPALKTSIVAGIVEAFADPEVQKKLGITITPNQTSISELPGVASVTASAAAVAQPGGNLARGRAAARVFNKSAAALEEALDPEDDDEVVILPQSKGDVRVMQATRIMRESALAASTMSNALVGTSDAAASIASTMRDVKDISGITRKDVDEAKAAMKDGYKKLSKKGESAQKVISKKGTAAGKAVNTKTRSAYAALKNEKAPALKTKASSAKSTLSTKGSSAKSTLSTKGSSAKSSIGKKGKSFGGSLRKKAGTVKRGLRSKAQFDVSVLMLRGQALQRVLDSHSDHLIAANLSSAPDMRIETPFISSSKANFDAMDKLVDDSLKNALAASLRTESSNKTADASKKKNPVTQGFLEGFSGMMSNFTGSDGIIAKTYLNLQTGVMEKGGVVLQMVQYSVKEYWSRFIKEWLPTMKDRFGEYTDVFLRETLPQLMRDLPNLTMQGIGTVSELVTAVVSIVSAIANLIQAEMVDEPSFHARVISTFADSGLDAVIKGDASAFNGRFLQVDVNKWNPASIRNLANLRDAVVGTNFYDLDSAASEKLIEVMMKKEAPEMHASSMFSDIFKRKKKDSDAASASSVPSMASSSSLSSIHDMADSLPYSALVTMLKRINKNEDGFSKGSVKNYAEEVAAVFNIALSTSEPEDRKKTTRSIISFLLAIINRIGDMTTVYGSRPLEVDASGWLSAVIDGISNFQQKRVLVATQKKSAATQAEIDALERRLAELRPTADMAQEGSFGNLLNTVKTMVKGKKKPVEDEFSAEAERISDQQRVALQKIVDEANNPQNIVDSTIRAGAEDILAMANERTLSDGVKVQMYIDHILADITGGDFQGRDANEMNLLKLAIKFMSACLLFFMNAEGDWADINIALFIENIDAPLSSARVAASIKKLRASVGGGAAGTKKSREKNIMASYADKPSVRHFNMREYSRAHCAIADNASQIPIGASINVIDDGHAHSIVVSVPGASTMRSLTGEHYEFNKTKEGVFLRRDASSTLSSIVPYPLEQIELRKISSDVAFVQEQKVPLNFYYSVKK